MRAKDFDRKHFFEHEWPEALESGEYKQCRDQLRDEDEGEVTYCCLGVACDLLRKKKLLPLTMFKDERTLPQKAQALLNLTELGEYEKGYRSLAQLNDEKGASFKFIANRIRKLYAEGKFDVPVKESYEDSQG